MTDRYVVIGNPVTHSQSPYIHAAFARQTGDDMRYDRLECAPDGFEATLRAFVADGGRGCNVTVPFKFQACRLAQAHTPRGAIAGACNALRFDAGRWLGDNTDGAGLLRDIEGNAGVRLKGRRVLLIGAGGGAAGVLGPLLGASPSELVVANRSPQRAADLVARFEQRTAPATVLRATALEDCGRAFDIVINATASSMLGAGVPVGHEVLAPGALAIDMMYGPAALPFVTWASAHGATARDGLGMLVEQAAEAFEFFRGSRPETASVLSALRQRMARSEP